MSYEADAWDDSGCALPRTGTVRREDKGRVKATESGREAGATREWLRKRRPGVVKRELANIQLHNIGRVLTRRGRGRLLKVWVYRARSSCWTYYRVTPPKFGAICVRHLVMTSIAERANWLTSMFRSEIRTRTAWLTLLENSTKTCC